MARVCAGSNGGPSATLESQTGSAHREGLRHHQCPAVDVITHNFLQEFQPADEPDG